MDDIKNVAGYRHDERRPNNPEAGLPPTADNANPRRTTHHYDPHLAPELNFATAHADLAALIESALASDDLTAVKEALQVLKKAQEPFLNWSGKSERTSFEIDEVALHVHERVDPATILAAAEKHIKNGKELPQGSFVPADPASERLPLSRALQYYQHEKNWSNRLIAGDSLLVMNSLLQKEGMAGSVHMVYLDPPYGIGYGSNFQPFVGQRSVHDGKDEDLSREPETIKAFRDTWQLGIHSYLGYLRDRLLLARELLADSGSIFVQISDENLHLVRNLLDEVFGRQNFISVIPFKKKGSQKGDMLPSINDYLLWYGKDRDACRKKFKQLYFKRELTPDQLSLFRYVELKDGHELTFAELAEDQKKKTGAVVDYRYQPRRITKDYPGARIFRSDNATGGGQTSEAQRASYVYKGVTYHPPQGSGWKHAAIANDGSLSGMDRMAIAGRLYVGGRGQLGLKRYWDDFPYTAMTNWWDGLAGVGRPIYVVQTNEEVVRRCVLMSTDAGDLVFDPTCGSGTTALVAERWGRRWITCDTSRVALTLARRRLLTAVFDYYQLAYPEEGPRGGFEYATVPHLTSTFFANHPEIKAGMNKATLDELIARDAPKETLYDRPTVDKSKVRVSGQFTVEAVPAPVVMGLDEHNRPRLDDAVGLPEDVPVGVVNGAPAGQTGHDVRRGDVRLGEVVRQTEWREALLRSGVRGKGGEVLRFAELGVLPGAEHLHAVGRLQSDKDDDGKDDGRQDGRQDGRRVAVSFGPEHAALGTLQMERALQEADTLRPRPAFLLYCAFMFDPEAAREIEQVEWPNIALRKVQMNADLLTEDLKKTSAASFWLMGQPDVALRQLDDERWQVEVRGFDYFDAQGDVISGKKEQIALWSLDTDYDGRSLFPHQVFFPGAAKDGDWVRLRRALRTELDGDRLASFFGTKSLPFAAGDHARAAVKIVDDRGIESLRVLLLKDPSKDARPTGE